MVKTRKPEKRWFEITLEAAVVIEANMSEETALRDLRKMAGEEGLKATKALANALLQRDSISRSDRIALLEVLKSELGITPKEKLERIGEKSE